MKLVTLNLGFKEVWKGSSEVSNLRSYLHDKPAQRPRKKRCDVVLLQGMIPIVHLKPSPKNNDKNTLGTLDLLVTLNS